MPRVSLSETRAILTFRLEVAKHEQKPHFHETGIPSD